MRDRFNPYIVENGQPKQVTWAEFSVWHENVDPEIRTGLGYTLARFEDGTICISIAIIESRKENYEQNKNGWPRLRCIALFVVLSSNRSRKAIATVEDRSVFSQYAGG